MINAGVVCRFSILALDGLGICDSMVKKCRTSEGHQAFLSSSLKGNSDSELLSLHELGVALIIR